MRTCRPKWQQCYPALGMMPGPCRSSDSAVSPDLDIATICQQEGRAIITLDLDFGDIRADTPADYAGIIVLRLHQQDKMRILALTQRLIPLLEQEPLVGKLWIVDEATIRVRE